MGVVLSLRGLKPETSAAQQVLPHTAGPGFSHFCVWSVLWYLVLHHHSGGTGINPTKKGTTDRH